MLLMGCNVFEGTKEGALSEQTHAKNNLISNSLLDWDQTRSLSDIGIGNKIIILSPPDLLRES